MLLVLIVFWVVMIVGRSDLGRKGWLICAPLGIALQAAYIFIPPVGIYALVALVFLDIILILYVFGGDIRIK